MRLACRRFRRLTERCLMCEHRCEVRLMHGGPGGPYSECHANVTVHNG